MRWLSLEEARELGVTYAPYDWKAWRIEPSQGGAIAISETNNGKVRMEAFCTKKHGPQVVLTQTCKTGFEFLGAALKRRIILCSAPWFRRIELLQLLTAQAAVGR